jgi:CIC family chloride channel protein
MVDWVRSVLSQRRSEARTMFVLTLVVGAAGGVAAEGFQRLIDLVRVRLLLPALAQPPGLRAVLVILLLAGTGLVVGILLDYEVPFARGSGIPEVKTSYVIAPGPQVSARTVIGKFLLGALSIGSGFSLGREGPIVQICAGIGAATGRAARQSPRFVKNLISVGAAAGIAAAFNTPIAAVTFALEEIVGDLNQRLLGSIVVAAVAASVVERAIRGNTPIFSVPAYALARWWELVFYALLGGLAGLGATLFVKSLLALRRFVWRWKGIRISWLKPAIGGALVAGIGLAFPRVFGIGYDTLNDGLLGRLTFDTMVTLCVMKLLATVLSYGWGVSGGLFSPTLFMGGMLGGALGYMVQRLIPGSTHAVGSFALVGMSAFFAAAIRTPITAILIIFEMTGDYAIILPLMISSTISYSIASALQVTPIYDAMLEQDGIYLGEHRLRPTLRQVTVDEVMTTRVVTATSKEPAGIVAERLQQAGLRLMPIVDEEGRMTGIVTADRLRDVTGADQRPISDLASDDVVTVSADQTLDLALFKLGRYGIGVAPVVEHGEPERVIGILSLRDIANGLARLRGSADDAHQNLPTEASPD